MVLLGTNRVLLVITCFHKKIQKSLPTALADRGSGPEGFQEGYWLHNKVAPTNITPSLADALRGGQ